MTTAESLSRAKACHSAGDLAAAQALYERVVATEPSHAEAWYLLGTLWHHQGQLELAVDCLQRAAQLRPLDGNVQCYLGAMLTTLGRLGEAEHCLRHAVQLAPNHVEAHHNLAAVLARQGNLGAAIDHLRCAATLAPNDARMHFSLGFALAEQKQFAEAIAHYRRVLELDVSNAAAHNNLGAALHTLGTTAEAAQCFRRAIELRPNLTSAYTNLAAALVARDDLAGAEACFRRAIELDERLADANRSLGTMLVLQARPAEAVDCYMCAIALKPDWAEPHVELATTLFLTGRWTEAWPHYEWRFEPIGAKLPLAQPRWRGEPLDGRTILLHSEQGLGDALQFVRYAPLVKQRGATVIVECQPQLASLLATCPGVDRVSRRWEPLPPFDTYIQLLSLPRFFGTTPDNIPAEIPYLRPPAELVEHWRAELRAPSKLKVGIAWQGSKGNSLDSVRSIPLDHFGSLARNERIQLYSLQMGDGREQLARLAGDWPIVDLADRLGDFENTAAIVKNLDLVITCDSAPAHLAGALGVPVWIALRQVPDWRWMLDRADSPWYPTARLFRQTSRGDWPGVFRQIDEALNSSSPRA